LKTSKRSALFRLCSRDSPRSTLQLNLREKGL